MSSSIEQQVTEVLLLGPDGPWFSSKPVPTRTPTTAAIHSQPFLNNTYVIYVIAIALIGVYKTHIVVGFTYHKFR